MSTITCPTCQTLISVDTELYLKGTAFNCASCNHKIGLEEKTDLSPDKLELFKKFAKIKKKKTIEIPCPDCGTLITGSHKDMLAGKAFSCPNCNANVGI